MNLYVLILILHVLGAGLLIGIILFSVFLSVKPTWSQEKLSHFRYIGQFGKWGSAWQLFTGLYLASTKWPDIVSNKLFLTKMALYVIEGTLAGLLIERKIKSIAPESRQPLFSATVITHAILIIFIVGISVIIVESQ